MVAAVVVVKSLVACVLVRVLAALRADALADAKDFQIARTSPPPPDNTDKTDKLDLADTQDTMSMSAQPKAEPANNSAQLDACQSSGRGLGVGDDVFHSFMKVQHMRQEARLSIGEALSLGQYTGTIERVRPSKFAFIHSPDFRFKTKSGDDVFLDGPHYTFGLGDVLEFDVFRNTYGRPQARYVKFVERAPSIGQYSGTITKKMPGYASWITSQALGQNTPYGADVFLGDPDIFNVGDLVRFDAFRGSRNKPKARDAKIIGWEPSIGHYHGRISCAASESPDAIAWIVAPALNARTGYSSDVFLSDLGMFSDSDLVHFDAFINPRNQPQARFVEFVARAGPHYGMVKCVGRTAFIHAPSLKSAYQLYGNYVFLQDPGSLNAGDGVHFDVFINERNQPQARHVLLVERAPSIGEYVGQVSRVSGGSSAWIVSEGFDTDIYYCEVDLHRRGTLRVWDMVQFDAFRNLDFMPQARHVRPLPRAPAYALSPELNQGTRMTHGPHYFL